MADTSAQTPPDLTGKRIVAESWYLGDGLLGKGGFGFVKMGYHVQTNKPFALKFIKKQQAGEGNEERAKAQATQVATEINCLIRMDHENVLKLYAYRANCEYPTSDGPPLNTIMMVLELAQGGDLFDILFYTKALPEVIARTYFHQMCSGMAAMHAANIAHRDLKPQNLLLNRHFQLKITDFGLSKMFEEQQSVEAMQTYYAGTQGYQAPEQLLQRPFTMKVDVFAAGIILFVLMFGYPPIQEAKAQDPWFKYLAGQAYDRFWAKHRRSDANPDLRNLIQKCLSYQPKQRYTAEEVLQDAWVNGEILDKRGLREAMRERHAQAVEAKKNDASKQEQLAHSNTGHRAFDTDGVIPITNEVVPIIGTHQLSPDADPVEFVKSVIAAFESMSGSAACNDDFEVEGHITAENEEGKELKAGMKIKLLRRSESSPVLCTIKMFGGDTKNEHELKNHLHGVVMGQIMEMFSDDVDEFLEEDEYDDADLAFLQEFNAQSEAMLQ